MAGAEPAWLTPALAIAASFGTAATAYIVGRKKAPEPQGGEAKVIAGSIMGSRAVDDLSVSIRNLDGSVRGLTEVADDLRQHLHDEAMIRAAAARIREGK